jgi:uncharacterized membrane protein
MFLDKPRKIVLGISVFWFSYLSMPFLAPILMKLGYSTPANLIYTVYSVLCHQRAERSIFLFGEKASYSMNDLKTAGINSFMESREFEGTDAFGYKVAFCFRDAGIYLGLLLTGILFLIKPDFLKEPLKIKYVIAGITPMILDGVIQLIAEICANTGLNPFGALTPGVPFYLSTNLKRIITGMLFGGTIGFWLYPSIIKEFK